MIVGRRLHYSPPMGAAGPPTPVPVLALLLALGIACAPYVQFLLQSNGSDQTGQWSFQTDWDDRVNFLENGHLQGIVDPAATSGGLWQHLKWMWGSQGVILGVYEPLSWTFKTLVIAASGRVHAHTFFTTSVVLHGINTLLLATLTVKMLAFAKLPQRTGSKLFENEAVATWKAATTVDWLASALAASVYASHPLRVEIVGWLSCQSYLVGSAAALLCLHLHADGFLRGQRRTLLQRAVVSAAAFLCFVVAILCKATMTPLPAILLLLDVLLYDPRGLWSGRAGKVLPAFVLPRAVLSSLFSHGLYFVASGVVLWRAYAANKEGMQPGSVEHGIRLLMVVPSYSYSLTTMEKVVKGGSGVAWYLTHTIWPRDLAIFYPVSADFNARSFSTAAPAALVFAVTSGFVCGVQWASAFLHRRWFELREEPAKNATAAQKRAVRTFRMGALVWGSMLCTVLPTLGLVQHGWEIHVADRYSYLPSMCLVPPFAFALRQALAGGKAIASRKDGPSSLRLILLLSSCFGLSAALALKSNGSLRKWKCSESLWTHAVNYGPSDAIAHYNMGCVMERGAADADADDGDGSHENEKRSLAKNMFAEALRIDPYYGAAHNNMGYLIEKMAPADSKAAAHHYQEAIRLNPGHYTAHNNLGRLMHRMSRLEEAEAHYRQAVLLYPGYVKALYNLATLIHTTGGPAREHEAEAFYRQAILSSKAAAAASGGHKSQQLAEVYYNLAQLLGMRNGATDPELAGLLQAALEIKPSYHRAQQTLDHVMAETGAGINSN